MSAQAVNIILILGALGFTAIALINRCEWFKWCDDLPDGLEDIENIIKDTVNGVWNQADQNKLAKAIGEGKLTAKQFNSLPTVATQKNSSNIRSTRINTNPNAQKNAAAKIKQQQDFSPGSKTALDAAAYLNATGYKPPAKSTLAMSLFGRRMSIR